MLVFRDRNAHPTFYLYSNTLPKGLTGAIIRPPPWVRTSGAGVEATGWDQKLAETARTCCEAGPIAERVEVHSHGVPGGIVLNPLVTYQNVGSFAALLSRLVKRGGMIELLCCMVAKPNINILFNATLARDRATADLCQALSSEIREREEAAVETGRGLVFAPAAAPVAAPRPVFGGLAFKPVAKISRLAPQQVVRLLEASVAMQEPGDPMMETGNGPIFCAQLAKLTACRVRAALGKQYEEQEEFETSESTYKAVGSWEGHVVDFLPSGKISYAGYDLPRPMFPQLELLGAPLGLA